MAWPDDTSLPVYIGAAFGADLTAAPITWDFTDLTDRYKRLGRPITIRGGGAEGSEPAAGTGTADLDNDDGQLTPGHAGSDWWPNVDLNTPVIIGTYPINPISDSDAWSTSSTNSLGVSDGGRTWLTITAGGTPSASDFQVTGGVATLSVPAANAYRAGYVAVGAANVDVACTVSAAVTVAGGPIEPGGLILRLQDITHYYLCRISVAVGGAITASINASGGTGELVSGVVSGLTWSSGVALRIRAQAWGTWIRMRVWRASDPEPTAWTLTAVDDQFTAAGGAGFRSGVASGNTNTKPIVFSQDNFTMTELPTILTDGYADGWKPTYLPTTDRTFVSAVRLTASGLFRRLGQGKSALRSAAYRAITAANPEIYLPCENGQLALLTSPGLTGITAGTTLSYGSDGLGISVLSLGNAPAPAVTTTMTGSGLDFQIDWVARWAADTTVGTRILEWTTAGSLSTWRVNTATNGSMTIEVYDEIAVGWVTLITANVANYDGNWAHYSLIADDNGVGVFPKLYINGQLIGSGSSLAVGRPIKTLTVMPVATTADVSVAHIAIWSVLPVTPPSWYAVLGHPGEAASDRIARLCGEEGIPVYVEAGDSEALDIQQAAGLLEILRAAARADMGILSEYMWGLRYRPRSARYNRAAAMEIDLSTYRYPGDVSADTILTPTFDDQGVRNDWTVNRAGGSAARVVDTAHAARYGTYDDSVELEVPDSRLADHASFRTYLGTWPGMRYPDVPLHLHANPSLIPAWTAMSPGDRIDRINPPPQHPPGPISQIFYGYSMTLEKDKWTVALACGPYEPWEIATVAGAKRVAAKGSTLAVGIDSDDLTLSFASTAANGLWRTTASIPAAFPVALRIGGAGTYGTVGGEIVTASVISGGSSPQAATLTARGVNGVQRAWPAGSIVQVAYPARLAL